MKYIAYSLFIIAITVSCGTPEARRPVSVKTGSFFKQSVDRSKQLLIAEENLINTIIEKDTINTYYSSPNGYSYYYNIKNETASYYPKTDDLIKISYDIRNMDNTVIYSNEEIGVQTLKVDKVELFPGLRTAIKLLNKGETITFLFPSAMAHGYHGDNDKIGVNVPIISTVSLLDIIETSEN